jgi:hypothetical protein
MLAVRIVVLREFVEAANAFKDLRKFAFGKRGDAVCHDDLAAGERTAEDVVEFSDSATLIAL